MPRFPCQLCGRAVSAQRGVACDDCDKWHHVDCMNMNTIIYDCLNNVSWHCINCGMPQFSSSLFSSVDISTNNSYATLDDADIGPPNATSSPISSPTRVTQPKPKPWEKIQISIINFQSIKNKKAELLQKISQLEPTVIIGTETWLNPNIHSSEIFPPNYADSGRKEETDTVEC